ncbi:hypothetical protein C8R43DRAFT_1036404 [Mycena crocata]|nr:hypothetical protein C8R43DRAFT_1036404 [Mycena crocata]
MSHYSIVCHSPSSLTAIGREIIHLIMMLSGPADLKIIGSVCVFFRAVLKENPSCWQYARKHLSIPPPPFGAIKYRSKDSPIQLSDVLDCGSSEHALIEYIFCGGCCTVCGCWSSNIPHNFALNWRTCSSACRKKIMSLNSHTLQSFKTAHISRHSGLGWLIGQKSHTGVVYIKTEVVKVKAKAKEVRKMPADLRYSVSHNLSYRAERAIGAFAALETWKPMYLKAVRGVRETNVAFLKTIAHQQQRSVHDLFKCPTLFRISEAFNRDLTLMGHNEWRLIKDVVCQELKAS